MTGVETVYPSQVIEAIAEARRRDESDKYGDKAFKVNLDNIRTGKNNVRYMEFQIMKKRPSGNWEYVPLNLFFMNLNTSAGIYPPGSDKKRYAGARLSIKMKNASFRRNDREQNYGKAKALIYSAFRRIMQGLLKNQKVRNSNTKISSCIQTELIIDEKTLQKEKLKPGEEIIRMEIPFHKVTEGNVSNIALDESPKCDIYDAEKPDTRPKGEKEFEFLKATTPSGAAITYGNIHEFITAGSSCSGVDCMDSVCLSSQGISLPSKVSLLIVKRSKGFKPDPKSLFGAADIAAIGSASVLEGETEPKFGDDPTADPVTETCEADQLDDLVDGLGADAFDTDELADEEPEPLD
jgi:hypothetical protein